MIVLAIDSPFKKKDQKDLPETKINFKGYLYEMDV